MLNTHSGIVKQKMLGLANVTGSAQDRITASILSNASSDLREELGDNSYQGYLDSLSEHMGSYSVEPEGDKDDGIRYHYSDFDTKDFGDLTNDEKALRNLIHAEAYFGLYYLAIALRKLVKGNVFTNRESAGGASVSVPGFDDIINNMELYRRSAYNSISAAMRDGDGDNFGNMWCFIL